MLKACSESIFLFNAKVYKQIDGLAMGSPLAPLLANWFVAKIENDVLQNPTIQQPKFYRRYVDDIFAVFHCNKDKEIFFEHLNGAHKNLTFTMEEVSTSKNSLPFLDVEISISDNEYFETTIYRKPTNTNVLINFQAMAPKKWKSALLKCFLNRAHKICSTKELIHNEVNNIRRIFKSNGYPEEFVDTTIAAYAKKLDDTTNETNNEAVSKVNAEEKKAYMVLPYVGKCSHKLHHRIRREVGQHGLEILPAFRTTKVQSYFSLKTMTPPLFRKDVVYKFECPCDKGAQYIGETERQLFMRVKDRCTTSTKASVKTA